MSEPLSAVCANVQDPHNGRDGAVGDGIVDDTEAIQRAINTGLEVLFPAGTYSFRDVLEFNNDGQRTRFYAGAVLVPYNSDAYVSVTGKDQVIHGMRIEAPSDIPARSPMVDIYRADELVMEDLRVSVTQMSASVSGPRAAVRVMYLTKCKFMGGAVSGGQESGTVGLWLASSYDYDYANTIETHPRTTPAGEWSYPDTGEEWFAAKATSGAYECGAMRLTVQRFGWGVRVGCICDNPNFIECSFVDNVDGALLVRDDADVVPPGEETVTYQDRPPEVVTYATPVNAVGLNLVSCSMSGSSPQYVQVDAASYWSAGAVSACTFGGAGLPTPTLTIPSPHEAPAAPQTPCIFRILGTVAGVVVAGCQSEASPLRASVWHIAEGANTSGTCDACNAWAEAVVAEGRQGLLARATGNDSGELTLQVAALELQAAALGFFDASPDGRGASYTVHGGRSRTALTLGAGNVRRVLSDLLLDLGELGLVTRRRR